MSKVLPRTVGDLMTREVITLFEEDNLERIEEGMQRYRFRHLPVVDDGKLVGLVTHRDILRAQASSLETGSAQKNRLLTESVFVRDIMQQNVTTVKADMALSDAGDLMVNEKRGCLPVVDDAGNLVGIITEADFVKLAVRLLRVT
ncbi:MAG: CBS domain-containing protein [Polyangiaceae bacterium]